MPKAGTSKNGFVNVTVFEPDEVAKLLSPNVRSSIFNLTAIDFTLLEVWSSSLVSFNLNLANLNLKVADCVMSPKDVQSANEVVDVAICTL